MALIVGRSRPSTASRKAISGSSGESMSFCSRGVARGVLLPGLGVVLQLQIGRGRVVAMPRDRVEHAGGLRRELLQLARDRRRILGRGRR